MDVSIKNNTHIIRRIFLFYSKNSIARSNSQIKFRWYSLYAWTSPLLMTFGGLLMKLFKPDVACKVELTDTNCVLMLSCKEDSKCLVKLTLTNHSIKY